MARAKCYHTMDAFVKLVVVLVRYSGDAANTVTKVNLLNKVSTGDIIGCSSLILYSLLPRVWSSFKTWLIYYWMYHHRQKEVDRTPQHPFHQCQQPTYQQLQLRLSHLLRCQMTACIPCTFSHLYRL